MTTWLGMWDRPRRVAITLLPGCVARGALPRVLYQVHRRTSDAAKQNMANGNFISYYRVSTERQGRSGLGLEAQEEAVRNYLNGRSNWRLVEEVVEVEKWQAQRPTQARRSSALLPPAQCDAG